MGVRSEKQTGASGGSRSHSQGPGFSSFLAPLGIVNLADGCLVYISKKKKKKVIIYDLGAGRSGKRETF